MLHNEEFSAPDGFGQAASRRFRNDVFVFVPAGPRFLTKSTAVWGDRFQPGPTLLLVSPRDTPISV